MMTVFVIVALLLALIAAGFVARPLLQRGAGRETPWLAAGAVTVILAGAFAVYALTSGPDWTRNSGAQTDVQDISTLARHLDAAPADLAGWLSLGQAYTAIGQYPLALRAYQRANRLGNGGNAAALAGMGETLTLSGDASQRDKAAELFEHALQLEPESPKALFYTAVAAMQAGHLELARQRFTAMLALQPPPSVQTALKNQLAVIDAKLGAVDPRTAIHIQVTLAPQLAAQIPKNAALFVFVQAPQGGPPLAVRRLDPTLPQTLTLSAADAVVATRSVKAGQAVTVAARISASGNPLASPGDLFGEVRYIVGKDPLRELRINQRQ